MDPQAPEYPQYPGTTLPIATPPKKSHKRTLLLVAGFVATFLVGIGIGAAAGGGSTADANLAAPAPEVTITQSNPLPAVTVFVTPTPSPKPAAPAAKPKPAKATIPDGESVVVGSDVPAGRYDAHSTDDTCYWEIDKHATSDIVDNDLGKQGHLVVTLKKGEDFSSERCGDWKQE